MKFYRTTMSDLEIALENLTISEPNATFKLAQDIAKALGIDFDIREDGYVNATKLCKSLGKEWFNFKSLESTNALIRNVSTKFGLCENIIAVSTTKGPLSLRGTWIHPELARCLYDWCARNQHDKMKRGCVYLITSEYLNAVKIGMWTGTKKGLQGRYITPYGSSLEMHTRTCGVKEREMHLLFKEYRIEGELFDKSHFDEYKEALDTLVDD